MSKKIKIKSAPGSQNGWDDGTDYLVNFDLYFEETSTAGQFLLYAPSKASPPGPATVIPTTPTPLTNNTNFSFTWQGFTWSITSFAISITQSGSSEHGTASGSWTATPVAASKADPTGTGTGGDPETGTFQANDSVTVEGESSASAYA